MQQSSDPDLLKIISDTAKQLSPGTPLKVLGDGSWQFDDNAGLHFEPCEGTLLAVLRMPEQHLDATQLRQLLALGAMDWPTPIAASLCANEAQALLFMKRQITHKYTQGKNILSAYLLAPGLEEALRSSVRQTSSGSYIVLDPKQTDRLLDAVHDTVDTFDQMTIRPVILAAMDVRRYMRKLIERDYPDLAVVAYQELQADVQVQSIGQIDADLSVQ